MVHSNVATYLDEERRVAFRRAIDRLATERDLAWVFAESPGVVADMLPGVAQPELPWGAQGLLGLVTWVDGRTFPRILAAVGPHGSSLDWLGD